MIRITLNLGRRPAENLRRARVIWGGALVVLLALFFVLAAVAVLGWLGSRQIQAETDAVRAEMAPLLADQAEAQAPLRDPEVRGELDRAAYFNQLIDRRSVSWTRLFERLEQLMPPGVELVSLRPLERNGAQAMDVRFASESMSPAIDFMHALEISGDFADARLARETDTAAVAGAGAGMPGLGTTGPRFQLEVTALYRPRPLVAPPAAAANPAGAHGGQP